MNDRDLRPDEELASGIAKGDDSATAALVRRYVATLYDFVVRTTLDAGMAAAAVEATFARARDGLAERPDLPLRSWLLSLARDEALEAIRQRGRVEGTADGSGSLSPVDERFMESDDSATEADVALWTWQSARGQRPRDYCFLDLALRRKLTPQEIADIGSLSRTGVYGVLGRLRGVFEESFATSALYHRGRHRCPELDQLVKASTAGLAPSLRRDISRHAESCGACTQTRVSLSSAADIFAELKNVPPPDGLAERLLPGAARAIGTAPALLAAEPAEETALSLRAGQIGLEEAVAASAGAAALGVGAAVANMDAGTGNGDDEPEASATEESEVQGMAPEVEEPAIETEPEGKVEEEAEVTEAGFEVAERQTQMPARRPGPRIGALGATAAVAAVSGAKPVDSTEDRPPGQEDFDPQAERDEAPSEDSVDERDADDEYADATDDGVDAEDGIIDEDPDAPVDEDALLSPLREAFGQLDARPAAASEPPSGDRALMPGGLAMSAAGGMTPGGGGAGAARIRYGSDIVFGMPPPSRPWSGSGGWFGDGDKRRNILLAVVGVLTIGLAYLGFVLGSSIEGGGGDGGEIPPLPTRAGGAREIACGTNEITLDQGSRATLTFDPKSLPDYAISNVSVRGVSPTAVPQSVDARAQQGLSVLFEAREAGGTPGRTDEYKLTVTFSKGEERTIAECTVLVKAPAVPVATAIPTAPAASPTAVATPTRTPAPVPPTVAPTRPPVIQPTTAPAPTATPRFCAPTPGPPPVGTPFPIPFPTFTPAPVPC